MKNILQTTKQSLVTSLLLLDTKITKLIPNPKMKKITYIGIGSLFGLMFLIIVLGTLISPFIKRDTSTGLILKRPNIIVSSPVPLTELSETQKRILNLETQIKELRFPESILNIPLTERELSI